MSQLTEELKGKIFYNKDTGIFTRKIRYSNTIEKTGSIARRKGGTYIVIYINKKAYYAHRLAWAYVYGSLPNGNIDHINGDGTDNRIENLRIATPKENMKNKKKYKNNKSGISGVHFIKASGKYRARIGWGKSAIHLGYFLNLEEAESAVCSARALDGYSDSHGKR